MVGDVNEGQLGERRMGLAPGLQRKSLTLSLGGTTQAVRQVSACYSTPSCQGNSQLLIDSATY